MTNALFASPAFDGHEGVHAFYDRDSGLQAIIALHSTHRGPACGGARMWPYESPEAALEDVLRLSRAMSFKNAIADLDLGGGKAVIIADSRVAKTPELFEAFGRAVEQLGGRYYAAEDMGVSPADLAHARRCTDYVVGLEGFDAASGDPSPLTAKGVHRGIVVAVRHAFGHDSIEGMGIAVQGVGHVGGHLCDSLAEAGARLFISDIDRATVEQVALRTGAKVVAPDEIYDVDADVFSPCARGAIVNAETLPRIKARVIAGAANNQLASAQVGQAVFDRGIVYAPDYLINAGGIINVAAELRALNGGTAYDREWVETKLTRLIALLDEVLARSRDEGRPSQNIADDIARARLGLTDVDERAGGAQ